MVLKGRVLERFLVGDLTQVKLDNVMSKKKYQCLRIDLKSGKLMVFLDKSWFKTPNTQESPENMYCVHLSDILTD